MQPLQKSMPLLGLGAISKKIRRNCSRVEQICASEMLAAFPTPLPPRRSRWMNSTPMARKKPRWPPSS